MIFFSHKRSFILLHATLSANCEKPASEKDSKDTALCCSRAASILSLGPHLRRSFLVPALAAPSTVWGELSIAKVSLVFFIGTLCTLKNIKRIISIAFQSISLKIAIKTHQTITVCELWKLFIAGGLLELNVLDTYMECKEYHEKVWWKIVKWQHCCFLILHATYTVWPQPIWKKVRSSWQIPPQHQSTYLGGPKSA